MIAKNTVILLDDKRKTKDYLVSELKKLDTRLKLLEKLKKAVSRDGIPLKIIENTLPVLETRTNEIQEKLDSDLRLEFATIKESKTGKLSDTLDIWITDSHNNRKKAEMHSGGEKLRLDLSLRISNGELLSATKESGQLQTMLLDEYFAPLDEVGQDRIMGILDHIAHTLDLRILFVTHSKEVQEYASDRFLVEKKNTISTVTRF